MEGKKFDQEKLRWDLVPADGFEEIVKVYTIGAKKYGDRNWEHGISPERIFGAIQRHLWAYWNGELYDKESGLLHLAHAAWNCLALITYFKRGMNITPPIKIKFEEESYEDLQRL